MAGRSAVEVDVAGLRNVSAVVRPAAAAWLRRTSLDLLGQSVRRAPVDEGTLRGSGSAHHGGQRIGTGADFDGTAEAGSAAEGGGGTNDLSAVVAFNEVYAAYQHEMTDLAHPKGGQAKYLQRPLEENATRYERALADHLAKAFTRAAVARSVRRQPKALPAGGRP